MITIRALALSFCLLGATAAAASERDWRAWALKAHDRHVLAGRVYDVATAELSSPQDGALPALPDGIVLLGEVHDNPAHHRVRAWLIDAALRVHPDRRPAVVFEQIAADRQPALERFKGLAGTGSAASRAAELFRLIEWEKSGWPPAEIYRPLFETVVAAHLPIMAGNPPREKVRAAARKGEGAIPPAERARLQLEAPLPAPLAKALGKELNDSHCGAMPPKAIGGMAVAQRYRDAYLADALLRGAERHGAAILIAGNGHVRSDRGVPWHIRRRAPGMPVMSLLMLEVEDGRTDPADYVPRDPDGKPAADLIIFTPRTDRPDPCRSLLKNKR